MPPPAIELAPGPGCPVRVLPMRRVGLANKIRRYALDEKGHHPD
jgi:hydrogenase maturation factor